MGSIYDRHRAAFSMVSAYAVLDSRDPLSPTDRVATVAFKFGNSVSVYIHWVGLEMVRGTAGGGGYDRQSASCAHAARRMPAGLSSDSYADGTPHHSPYERVRYAAFRAALLADDGHSWGKRLRDAGFTIWQAV
jgi:hypothetical protein